METHEPRGIARPDELLNHWVPRPLAPLQGYCRRVSDGDSYYCMIRTSGWDYPAWPMVRLARVDCPETDLLRAKGGPVEVEFGLHVAAWVRSQIEGRQIRLTPNSRQEKDNDNRWVYAVAWKVGTTVFDMADELTRRRMLKHELPAYAAANATERLTWGHE